jgi:hypothetical protein
MKLSMTVISQAGAWRTALVVVSLLGALVAGRPLLGSDDTVGEEKEAQQQQNQFQTIALDQQMQQMLGGGSGRGIEGVRTKAIAHLQLEIDSLDEACGLSDAQRDKLTLAARLEAAESMQLFEGFQRRYSGRTVDFQTREGQETWQQFHRELNEIQRATSRSGSARHLPGRVVGSVLDDRQRDVWKGEGALRRASQWRRHMDGGLAILGASVGITDRQHEALVAMLMEDPPRIDMGRAREMFGDHNPFVCWYALSRLDQDRLEAIFDARQWEKVSVIVRQGEQWQPQIDTLKLIEE